MSVNVRGSDRCEFYYYAAIQLHANYAEGLHFSAFHYIVKCIIIYMRRVRAWMKIIIIMYVATGEGKHSTVQRRCVYAYILVAKHFHCEYNYYSYERVKKDVYT